MGKKLLLIGGGGHCHSVLDSVIASEEYDEIGIVDMSKTTYMGVSVIGEDKDIPRLFELGWTDAFITVGSVGDTGIRRRLYQMVKEIGMNVPVLMDPSAVVGRDVSIAEGVFLGKRTVVNAGTVIGECAIINSGAVIEHDCRIGSFSHISPGAVLCGQVQVGDSTHIGAGSIVRQLITVGSYSLIGAGSVVVKDVPEHVKAYGNPCKVVEQ